MFLNLKFSLQTAERIRHKHPDKEWFQLTGLIHDLGKVMAFYDEPQWAVVGDTFPVGCAPRDSIVYGKESFKENKDISHPVYSRELGIYEKNCGLDKEYNSTLIANPYHGSLDYSAFYDRLSS